MKRMLIALFLCQAAAAVLAQSSHSDAASGATWRCGGIGDGSQQQIKSEAPGHDLMLTFATPDGAYLADVDVRVRHGAAVVLQAHCGGPLMLVDVGHQGTYQIDATSNGRTQHKAVTVGSRKPTELSFVWPAG